MDTAKNEDLQKFKDLSLPAFALWGSVGRWILLKEMNKLQEIRPDLKTTIIEGAAHCPTETHTQDFVNALLLWLSEH